MGKFQIALNLLKNQSVSRFFTNKVDTKYIFCRSFSCSTQQNSPNKYDQLYENKKLKFLCEYRKFSFSVMSFSYNL
jgi:hypothetical protein